jgi:pimeloyl-ACP methyl ester carboxylesterase
MLRYYLENDNAGRGFVLIGHSQGSYVLTALIAQEIDGQPVQDRLVSALLLGAAPTVARGQDVGGSFRSIPLCRSAGQTGCPAFRSTAPPPENTLFGRAPDPSLGRGVHESGRVGWG